MIPTFTLDDGAVHIWHVVGSDFWPDLPSLVESLSNDERARGERYLLETSRQEYYLCRGLLRRLLANYGLAHTADIAFEYGPFGKPMLAPRHAANQIEFNLAHSNGNAILAFSRAGAVGVDIEAVRDVDYHGLAATAFAEEERDELRATPEHQIPRAFFNGWTRKESFIKAIGTGLSRPLASFAVTLSVSEVPRFIRIDGNGQPGEKWALADVSPDETHIAALTFQGDARKIQSKRLQPGCCWPL